MLISVGISTIYLDTQKVAYNSFQNDFYGNMDFQNTMQMILKRFWKFLNVFLLVKIGLFCIRGN